VDDKLLTETMVAQNQGQPFVAFEIQKRRYQRPYDKFHTVYCDDVNDDGVWLFWSVKDSSQARSSSRIK